MTSATAHSYLVDIFYHILQVAAHVAKLALECILDGILGRTVSDLTIRKIDGGFL